MFDSLDTEKISKNFFLILLINSDLIKKKHIF